MWLQSQGLPSGSRLKASPSIVGTAYITPMRYPAQPVQLSRRKWPDQCVHRDGDFCRSSEQVYRNHIPSSQGLGSFIFQAPGDVGVLAIPDSGISRRLIPKNGGNKLPPRPFGATYRKMSPKESRLMGCPGPISIAS